jgi:hypothetical protein
MGQVWAEVCEPRVSGEYEAVDSPDHPGASRVPYALMQGYYGSVCKMMGRGEAVGTGWLIRLRDLPGAVLKDPNTLGIVTAKQCCPTKESAEGYEAIFDCVDDTSAGLRCVLDSQKFYYSNSGKSEYVVIALRDVLEGRKPMKLGFGLTDAELPAGATITVVSHPKGLPREVSHGHITRVDDKAVYYNAGAKAASGSAVFFAHKGDLHVIALGLRGVPSDKTTMNSHEIEGVRVSRMSEVCHDASANTAKANPNAVPSPGAPPSWSQSGESIRITQVKDMKIKLPNGQQVTFTGSVKAPANVPHGTGTAVYDHGVAYTGEWSIGKRHGPGRITKAREGYYSAGECEDDLFIGTWTKYNSADDSFLEEQHYDHTTMDAVRRHLGFASRKAVPKEDQSPNKSDNAPTAK